MTCFESFLSLTLTKGSFVSTTNSSQDHHCPTPDDVFAVRSFLLAFVPAELANLILNEANYWPKAALNFQQKVLCYFMLPAVESKIMMLTSVVL